MRTNTNSLRLDIKRVRAASTVPPHPSNPPGEDWMKREKVHFGASIPTIIGVAFVSLLIPVGPLLFFFLATAFGPGGILVVSRHHVSDATGVSLEALDLNFDFIGNWEEVTVFARRPGEVRKTILFAYYPKPD